jgi:hypothetical protein
MDTAPLQAVQAVDALAAAAQALAEVTGVSHDEAAAVLGAVADALTQATPGLDAGGSRLLLREGLAERLLGPAQAAAAQEPSGAPLATADPAAETGLLQNMARPPMQANEAATQHQAGAEPPAPTADGGSTDFALPQAQLVPALLIGLQVDPGVNWMLPPGQPPLERARVQDDEREAARHEARDDGAAADEDTDHDAGPQPPPTVQLKFDAADARLHTLLRALHAALCALDAPPALRAAAEQWQRGRGVIVAFPQAAQTAAAQGAAWVYVLAPRATREAHGLSVRLAGPGFAAWLQWKEPPRGTRWWHARLVKEHHPRHGRRLVGADASQDGVCAVQLGPVLAERRVPCAVTLRIGAARSFWEALGVQWSALLLVCSLPLAGDTAVEVA